MSIVKCMLLGAHVSIAGGLINAPENAAKLGCEVFQFFTRSPRGGKAQPITESLAKNFKAACREFKQKEWYVHTPYYINFASTNNRIRYGSISVVREDLERASLLGAKYLMTHLGSGRGLNTKIVQQKTAESLIKVLDGYRGSTMFLIELSAGAGEIIGSKFEEVRDLIKKCRLRLGSASVRMQNAFRPRGLNARRANCRIGTCFDTAHAFASGYDLRDKKDAQETFKKFDKIIGLENLKLIHVNDSAGDFNSHIDRHANIGKGEIGVEGFKAIINLPVLKNINMILETPAGEGNKDKRVDDLKILQGFRE